MRRVCLLVFFFLSGLSALVYQIAWVRQASLTFGVSIYAYSAVVTAFMIGLALGSYSMGRWIDDRKRPLRIYAYVEIGVAALAALSPFVLTSLNGLYAAVSHTFQPSLGWLTLLRLVLSILVLTPATFLIGATLPLMSRIYATHVGRVGSDVGRLYLVNTAGGALGCLLAGIVLIRLLGLNETIFVGAGLNVLVALGALSLAWYDAAQARQQLAPILDQASAEATASERDRRAAPAPTALSPGALRYVAIGYAFSGFAALGYEVVWARILYIHTLHAVYSFSLMLAVFLSGMAAGSAFGTRWLRRHRATLGQFGAIQLAIGVLAFVVLFLFARLPSLHIDELLGGYSIEYELAISVITLFPPTFLMGLLFPLVSSLYTREQIRDVGLRIGTVNALNTLGTIIGSLSAGFLLIPFLGLRNTTLLLAGVNLALGCGALWFTAWNRPRLRWATVPVLSLPLVAASIVPPGIYLGAYEEDAEYLVFYREGVEATVAVLEMPERDFKVSFVNGRDEVPTDEVSMLAFRLLGHLPPLLRPQARNALVLSFGNGIATGTLDTHGIPLIDAVDLSPEMIEAARLYEKENYDVLNSPRLRLHIEDARNFLLQSDEQYDIITVDATHPLNASSWALFTREFYRLIRQRLAPGGVFMQWVPRHAIDEEDYRSIIRTAQRAFPHTTLWLTGGTHTFVVATPERLTMVRLDAALTAGAENSIVFDDLGPPPAIVRYLVMYEEDLGRYVRSGPVVTDNNAYFVRSMRFRLWR
jgi:spermidine synthase